MVKIDIFFIFNRSNRRCPSTDQIIEDVTELEERRALEATFRITDIIGCYSCIEPEILRESQFKKLSTIAEINFSL